MKEVREFRSITEGYRKYCSKSCRAFDMQSIYKSTLIKKYGDEHYNNETKRKTTFLNKYGNEVYFKSKNYTDKIKEKYGVKHIMSAQIIKNKMKHNSLKKYNTDYPLQSPIIQQKIQNNSYKSKSYKLPSGKIIKVQGYEPFALNYLLKTYSENDIITDKLHIPRIYYIKNNKKCIYYPDIFIKSTNTIIEVKSTWTNILNKEVNEMKKQSVLTNGFNFQKLIFNNKGMLVD